MSYLSAKKSFILSGIALGVSIACVIGVTSLIFTALDMGRNGTIHAGSVAAGPWILADIRRVTEGSDVAAVHIAAREGLVPFGGVSTLIGLSLGVLRSYLQKTE